MRQRFAEPWSSPKQKGLASTKLDVGVDNHDVLEQTKNDLNSPVNALESAYQKTGKRDLQYLARRLRVIQSLMQMALKKGT